MLKTFYPNQMVASAYDIPYEALYQRGIRALIFDIDNTLTEHGKPATKQAIALMERLKKIGFKVCLLSNNKEARVKMFNEKIQARTREWVAISFLEDLPNLGIEPMSLAWQVDSLPLSHLAI